LQGDDDGDGDDDSVIEVMSGMKGMLRRDQVDGASTGWHRLFTGASKSKTTHRSDAVDYYRVF
jgi:hypothetical protein